MALSVLLVVNTLGLSAFAAEGTASTQQSVTVSGMSDPAQDPAEESNEQLPPDYEAEPDEQPAQDSEDDPDEQPAQDSEDGAKEQLPPDSEDKENEEQLEAPVEQDEGVSRDAVHIAEDTFVLAGGTITGNESDGGAIVPAGSSSKFCIGDTNPINVTGNMIPHGDEFNVYLKNDRLITVEAVPADGSQIGITTANLPVAGTNVQNYVKFADVSAGVSAARAAGAFSSDAGFEVYDVDSSLYLRYNRIATWSELQDALDNGGEAEMVPPDDPNGDWDWIRIIRLTDDITAGNGDRALHFHHSDFRFAIDGKTIQLNRRSDGMYYLALPYGVYSNVLQNTHTYSITCGTGDPDETNTYTITASVLTYARSCAIKDGSKTVNDLGKALYLYNRAAVEAFGQQQLVPCTVTLSLRNCYGFIKQGTAAQRQSLVLVTIRPFRPFHLWGQMTSLPPCRGPFHL